MCMLKIFSGSVLIGFKGATLTVAEDGGIIRVCMHVSPPPGHSLGCNITAPLIAIDGNRTGNYIVIISL